MSSYSVKSGLEKFFDDFHFTNSPSASPLIPQSS
jgi:hypothetical protein